MSAAATATAVTAVPLPDAAAVRELLAMLLGTEVEVRQETKPVMGPSIASSLGTYHDDAGQLVAIVVTDVRAGASIGAGLAMMPKSRVEEAVKANAVPPEILDNLREVLNVGASLFNADGAAHVVFHELYSPARDAPPPAKAPVMRLTNRSELRISVEGYDEGVVSFMAL